MTDTCTSCQHYQHDSTMPMCTSPRSWIGFAPVRLHLADNLIMSLLLGTCGTRRRFYLERPELDEHATHPGAA